jgi:hypothetical protein
MPLELDQKQLFCSEKHDSKLGHFIWSFTRAYPVKHAFLSEVEKTLPNELSTEETKVMLNAK